LSRTPADKPNQDQPSFEAALEQLETIVHRLEEGDVGLNESLASYEQGIKLLRQCYDLLQKAERRIEQLSGVDQEGKPITAPLEDSALSLEEKARQRSRRRSTPRSAPPGDSGGIEPDDNMDVPGGLF
jgi:exodeoxyribonuclease VII small subunit